MQERITIDQHRGRGDHERRRQNDHPRAFWRDQFHGRADHTSDKSVENREPAPAQTAAEREGDAEARPIDGVGEEAFWSGTRVAGALYVLRANTFIRVSVGGISDERERVEKSRQLAVAALSRLK